jgi:hypothetical protein
MADLSAYRDSSALSTWFSWGEDEEAIWSSLSPGPSVNEISTRLSTMPRDFFDERVSLVAAAGDLFGDEHPRGLRELLTLAENDDVTRRGAGVALWLWASVELVAPFGAPLSTLWAARAAGALAYRLAPVVDPATWLVDAARRDEAARLLLLWSGHLPAGEDRETAKSMWERSDSLRRDAALQAMLVDHQHRVEVTAALRAKQAAEAAARYTHE